LADPPTLELGKPAQNCQHEELDRVVLLTSLLILVFASWLTCRTVWTASLWRRCCLWTEMVSAAGKTELSRRRDNLPWEAVDYQAGSNRSPN
jgi:hypothetical protein